METLQSKYQEWQNFIATREAARAERVNAVVDREKEETLAELKRQKAELDAQIQLYSAEIALAKAQKGLTYSKPVFDMEWAQKKATLKAELDVLFAEQIEAGVSIPKIMKKVGCKSPAWLYMIKENLESYRTATVEGIDNTMNWQYSDVVAVHRYAYGVGTDGERLIKVAGSIDTPLEGQHCVFEFETGTFISGNRDIYDDLPPKLRTNRADMLVAILEGDYNKKVMRDTNPYYGQH